MSGNITDVTVFFLVSCVGQYFPRAGSSLILTIQATGDKTHMALGTVTQPIGRNHCLPIAMQVQSRPFLEVMLGLIQSFLGRYYQRFPCRVLKCLFWSWWCP